MVWNPFVLQTLKVRSDSKTLFDSKAIPGEIVDMVVIGRDSLEKPGGRAFSLAIVDLYYEMNRRLADPAKGDALLVALGKKFSDLNLEEMKIATEQTKFYATANDGLDVYTGMDFQERMKTVVDFCVKQAIVPHGPKIAYGPAKEHAGADLVFDPSIMEEVKGKAP